MRALDCAYELGIVQRTRRMIRRGPRLVRTSNSYRFIMAAQEQAKLGVAHLAQQMREALARRKLRFDLSDRTAAKNMPLFNYSLIGPILSHGVSGAVWWYFWEETNGAERREVMRLAPAHEIDAVLATVLVDIQD